MKKKEVGGVWRNDDMVRDEEKNRAHKNRPVIKWLAIAACLFLMIGAAVFAYQVDQSSRRYFLPEERVRVSGDGITFLPMTTKKPKNFNSISHMAADMNGFIVHRGQWYTHGGRYGVDLDVVGKQVGTAPTTVNGQAFIEGFKNGDGIAGGIGDGVYALKGYDPDFIICKKDTGYALDFYYCTTGYTLKNGSDLLEDRLHLSRNLSAVKSGEQTWAPDHPVVQEFFHQLNEAPFLLADDMPDTAERLAGVTLQMKYGLHFGMSLYSDGYVFVGPLKNACLKLPKGSFEELMALVNGTSVMNHTEETWIVLAAALLMTAVPLFLICRSKSGCRGKETRK